MATLFSDDFNRADNDIVGGNWVENSGDFDIVSNQLKAISTTDDICSNTTTLGTANYEVELENWGTSSGNNGPIGRMLDASNYYLCARASTTMQLWKKVAGSWTQLGSNANITPAGGDLYKLSMNGTTIAGYFNGVQQISVTDSALSAEGDFGIRNDTSQNIWDDVAVYDFVAGGVTPRLALLGVG